MRTMLYLVRALAAADIYVSAVTMVAYGMDWRLVSAFIFGMALMVCFLVSDGVIGTWRDRRDAEEEMERRRRLVNRQLVARTMLDPIDSERVFPADKAERKKEENGKE